MIYLDSSVVLAHLLVEDRTLSDAIWDLPLISSRLLEYEVWNRLNARKLARSRNDEAIAVIGRVMLVELTPAVLARALEPFPIPVRTLDTLHLASIEFLRGRSHHIELASFDARMLRAADALEIPAYAG